VLAQAVGRFTNDFFASDQNQPPAVPVPPSVFTTAPVTKRNSSDASATITSALSSGRAEAADRRPPRPARVALHVVVVDRPGRCS
jgi:hypothetical protein